MTDKPRVLVADDEVRIHDFFIEALKEAPGETTGSELLSLEKELFSSDIGARRDPEDNGGYDLCLCTGASEAVDSVVRSLDEDRPFSVVFLDVRMPPGPDGIWAAEKIRALDKEVEIVIVTAFSDIHPADILRRVPPAHKLLYLQKPCYILEIRHLAAALTSKWIMERELVRIQRWQREHIRNQKSALDEAYNTLERMQKLDALGMFAGAMAHDFNNIMTAILGHTELALLDTLENQALFGRMESIHKACYKAKDLVRRILTFSRQHDPEFEAMAPGDVVRDVETLMQASIPKNITMQSRAAGGDILILADPTQVHQVLMNLCSNAVYAMQERGGTLDIRFGRIDDFKTIPDCFSRENLAEYVLLRVSDTGVGMDAATLEKIFDPYFTTKGKEEGTGLGLAVIHGIVKKQGGFVHVESKPFEGTTFYVFFKALAKA